MQPDSTKKPRVVPPGKILSDDDVEKYLARNHPVVLKALQRESNSLSYQRSRELPISLGAANDKPQPEGEHVELASRGAQIAEIMQQPCHWAYHIYPGLGAEHICLLVQPLLRAEVYQVFYASFSAGQKHAAIAKTLGINRDTVTNRLKKARESLFKALSEGNLPDNHEPLNDSFSEMLGLISENGAWCRISISKRPKYAYDKALHFCDCGHRLNAQHLNHQKKEVRLRRLRCDYCGAVILEKDWNADKERALNCK